MTLAIAIYAGVGVLFMLWSAHSMYRNPTGNAEDEIPGMVGTVAFLSGAFWPLVLLGLAGRASAMWVTR